MLKQFNDTFEDALHSLNVKIMRDNTNNMNQDRYEESNMHDEENPRTWKIVEKIIKITQKTWI